MKVFFEDGPFLPSCQLFVVFGHSGVLMKFDIGAGNAKIAMDGKGCAAPCVQAKERLNT